MFFILLITLTSKINLFQIILFSIVIAYFVVFIIMSYFFERKQLTLNSSVSYIKGNKSMAKGIGSEFQLIQFVLNKRWMFLLEYVVVAYFPTEELERLKAE